MNRVRSPLLDVVAAGIFHTVLAFSLFLLFAGHNNPGGGFVGGLVAGAAFVLQFLTDPTSPRPLTRVTPEVLLGVGLVLAAATGAAAWLTDGQFLESGKLELDLGAVGHVKVYSVLAFDTGVYLIVVGLVVAVLQALGREAAE
ncbi:MAG: hypothetical protein M5U14_19110 [Acidimicrobiia bacterium]|nr:hypothetical protein [Acidimicrobiia bacterium]